MRARIFRHRGPVHACRLDACSCLRVQSQASSFNHVWVLPSNNTYGGGPLTKSRACGASRIKVTTDRAVEYRHSITVSLDQHSRVVPTPDSVLLYVLGCVQLHVQLVGVMRNRTKQNSLIWVRMSYKFGVDRHSQFSVSSHPSSTINIHSGPKEDACS